MLKVAQACSVDIDEQDAVEEVCAQITAQLGDTVPQAGVIFIGADRDPEAVVALICARYPGLILMGCTSDAELCSSDDGFGLTEDSITLMVFASDEVRFKVGYGLGTTTTPQQAGSAAIEMMMAGEDEPPALVLTTPEGARSNVERVLAAMNDALGAPVPILGGTASDHFTMQDTRQVCGDQVLEAAVVVLGIFGPLRVGFGVRSGWKPVGQHMVITASEGNVVHTIDGQPATEVFEGLVDALDIATQGEYPLALYPDPDSDEHTLRGVFQADPEKGLLTFAVDMPTGAHLKLTWFELNNVIEGAAESLSVALEDYPGSEPDAIVVFTCCTRKSVMGLQAEQEFAALVGALPRPDMPMVGFYTYGEIAPAQSGRAMFHNVTCITVALGTT